MACVIVAFRYYLSRVAHDLSPIATAKIIFTIRFFFARSLIAHHCLLILFFGAPPPWFVTCAATLPVTIMCCKKMHVSNEVCVWMGLAVAAIVICRRGYS